MTRNPFVRKNVAISARMNVTISVQRTTVCTRENLLCTGVSTLRLPYLPAVLQAGNRNLEAGTSPGRTGLGNRHPADLEDLLDEE